MTEEEFEAAMEHFGDVIEETVEKAADLLDKSLTCAWRFRPVRIVGNTITFLTGVGLIVSAVPFVENGYDKTPKACLIGGSLVIAGKVVEYAVFRKK